MEYIPRRWLVAQVYTCPTCKELYAGQTGQTTYTCAAVHSPGTCCHYAERAVTQDQADRIAAILREKQTEEAHG